MNFLLILLFLQVKGIIIDSETREAVINVSIYCPSKEASVHSDINGLFSFPSISLGDTLIFTHIGYKPETLEVSSSNINVFLTKSYIELSPLKIRIQPFERKFKTTGTVYSKQGIDIELMGWEDPLKGISSYPGVIQGHIRGARKEEALYTLDGAPIIDNVQREVAFQLPVWAISEMELFTSDFEPEFGNVTSGLVILNSKKMNLKEHKRFILRSDYASEVTGKSYIEIRTGGFYSTQNGFYTLRAVTGGSRFWDVWKRAYPYPVEKSLDFLGNRTLISGHGTLVLQAISHLSEWREYEHIFRYYPQGLPERRRESHRFGLLYSKNFKSGWGVDIDLFDYILNYQVLGKRTREYDLDYTIDSLGYIWKGEKPVWTDRFQNRFLLKTKLQFIHPSFQGYLGFEGNYYDLYLKETRLYMDYIENYDFLSFMTYYNSYYYKPYETSVFSSLKIKNEGTILHFGLRYDRFDPRSYRPAVEIPLEYPPPDWVFEIKDSVKASPKEQISPRFAISTRMEDIIFRITFGRYFQIPQFEYLYSNPFYNLQRGYLPLYGDPDLKPSKTNLYEVSGTYIFNPRQNISINAFYRESSNLVDALRIIPDTVSYTDLTTGYTIYGDVGISDSYGLELAWEGIFPFLRWVFSYTLMTATGTFGNWLDRGTELQGVEVDPGARYPLSWDQTHTLALELTFGDPDKRFFSFYGKWGSGFPYSPGGGTPNSERLPPNFNATLKGGVYIGKALLSIIIDNPLDRRNILWVDGKGRPGGRLNDPLAYSEGRRIWLEFSWYF